MWSFGECHCPGIPNVHFQFPSIALKSRLLKLCISEDGKHEVMCMLSFPTRQFELGWKQITNYKLLLPGKTTYSQNITVNGILWYRPWGDLPLMLWVGLHIATPSVPWYKYRVFSRNVTAAMLVSLDKKMVSPTNPLRNELHSYSNALITWVKTLHTHNAVTHNSRTLFTKKRNTEKHFAYKRNIKAFII